MSVYKLLLGAEKGNYMPQKLKETAEKLTFTSFDKKYVLRPNDTRSTICVAYSRSGRYFASTHGDHTVKVGFVETHQIHKVLRQHARTPWACSFHPIKENLIASGCLAGLLIIWDWKRDVIISNFLFGENIISLAFHPIRPHVAVCIKDKILLWNYERKNNYYPLINNNSSSNPVPNTFLSNPTNNLNNDQMRAVLFSIDGNKMFYAFASPHNNRTNNVNIYATGYVCELSYRQATDKIEKITSNKLPFLIVLYNNGGVDFDEGGKLLLATVKLKNKMHRPPSPSSITNSGFNSRNISAYGFTLNNTAAINPSTAASNNINSSGYMSQPSGVKSYVYPNNYNTTAYSRNSYEGYYFRSNTNYVPQNISFMHENRNEKDKAAVCLIDLSNRWFGKIIYQYELKPSDVSEITCVKMSPSRSVALLSFQVKSLKPSSQVVRFLNLKSNKIESCINSGTDGVNMATFNPLIGYGLIYGTKDGALRIMNYNDLLS